MSDHDNSTDNAVEMTSGRQKLLFFGWAIFNRVRFIAILASVGLFIGYWDTLLNYWDKWTQPRNTVSRELAPDHEFYCPMDPQVVRSTYEPNGETPKCPICGMPLAERITRKTAILPHGVAGRVQLSPERIQLAGIKTIAVEYRPMAKQIDTVGYITFDESGLSRIVSRVDGYVEKLYVNENYAVVHKGDPLAEIYSPEFFSTARELVQATKDSGVYDLAASARTRLLLLGVDQKEIDSIEATGKAAPRLLIRSPQSGHVIDKKIVVGASVDAKMTLFEVADLSTVWVEAEVYEKDISFLKFGQEVEATVEGYTNRPFMGKISLVHPHMETATRTNRVRLKLENPNHELRPGMYVTARINIPLESIEPYRSAAVKRARTILTGQKNFYRPPDYQFLVVPERAVIDTGSKKVVYVEREAGIFEGVEVELGPRQDDLLPVLNGLKQGDKVAAAGGFLIDAETRLNPAAAAAYYGASGGPLASSPSNTLTSPVSSVRNTNPTPDDLENIQQLPEAERKLAIAQGMCPVTGLALGAMGVPVKVMLRGNPVFVCCINCVGKALRNPDETLKKLADLKPISLH